MHVFKLVFISFFCGTVAFSQSGKPASITVPVFTPREAAPRVQTVPRIVALAANSIALDSDVLKFPSLVVGKKIDTDLTSNVKYTGSGTVKYSFKVAGPAWLTLTPEGRLSGVPTAPKNFVAVVSVTDGTQETQIVLECNVVAANQPPLIDQAKLVFSLREREVKSIDLTAFVTSAAPTLTYRFTKVVGWATLSKDGKLTLSPKYAQLGNQPLTFEVTDGMNPATGNIRVTVVPDPQKPVWDAGVRLAAKVGAEISGDLSANAHDLDGRSLSFRKVNGAKWLNISADGKVFGQAAGPAGEQVFTFRALNDTLSADADVVVVVTQDNRPPQWLVPSIALKNARAGEGYSASVKDPKWVLDPDGDAITFSKISGLKWASVADDGTVSGNPTPSQVGPGSLLVQAKDPKGATAQITVNIQVDPPNAPPTWIAKEPIDLGQVQLGKTLNFSLLGKAQDPENGPLTFSKVSGPAWLTVEAAGKATGTPPAAEPLGAFNAVIAVSDDKTAVDGAFVGTVIPMNHPPTIDEAALKFTVDERRSYPFDLNKPGFVTDTDNDKLVFTLTSRVAWADMSRDGVLTLRATFAQTSAVQTLTFDVSDGKDVSSGSVLISVNRVPRPPTWSSDHLALTAPVGVPFTVSLKAYAQDLDKLPLSFSRNKAFGPSWLTVNADGTAHGTPSDENVGANNFIVVAQNDKLSAEGAITITVTTDNNPPQWKTPVVLSEGKSGAIYFQSVSSFAVDPDEDDFITFTIVTDPSTGKKLAPTWADMTSKGLIFGTPLESDVGVNWVTVRATDSHKAFVDAKVKISIVSKNNPPVWHNPMIQLGNVKVGETLEYDLSRVVSDADGDTLHFKKLTGPGWLLVSDDGQVGGKPKDTDVGPYTVTFEANDGKSFVPADGRGVVGTAAKPPLVHAEALSFTIAAGQPFQIALNDSKYVENPAGGELTFNLLSALPWVSLLANGALTLNPPTSQKGNNTVSFVVTNSSGGSAQGDIQIAIDASIQAPKWLRDLEFTAQADTSFTADLKTYAADLKKLPLTFAKVSGPDWLTINANGLVTGRPTAPMAAMPQVFQVSVSNKIKAAEATMTVVVSAPATRAVRSDAFDLSKSGEGAPVDLLFVLDNTRERMDYYEELKRSSWEFFDRLDQAKVKYSIAMLSSRDFVGRPRTQPSTGVMRLSSENAHVRTDFGGLVDQTRASDSYNSPIWALERFFVGLKSQTEFYRRGFYLEEVPLLVFVHTFSDDKYRILDGKGDRGSDPAQVARGFVNFHAMLHKPFELYISENSCNAAAAKVYTALAGGTGGKTLSESPCVAPFSNRMLAFANRVVDRATRYQKKRFLLEAKPKDVGKIRVAIRAGKTKTPLEGGTGSESDAWHYDAVKNAVVLHWWNIRLPANQEELLVDY